MKSILNVFIELRFETELSFDCTNLMPYFIDTIWKLISLVQIYKDKVSLLNTNLYRDIEVIGDPLKLEKMVWDSSFGKELTLAKLDLGLGKLMVVCLYWEGFSKSLRWRVESCILYLVILRIHSVETRVKPPVCEILNYFFSILLFFEKIILNSIN